MLIFISKKGLWWGKVRENSDLGCGGFRMFGYGVCFQ